MVIAEKQSTNGSEDHIAVVGGSVSGGVIPTLILSIKKPHTDSRLELDVDIVDVRAEHRRPRDPT